MDNADAAPPYDAAAKSIREYLYGEEKGLGLARGNVLDLFDEPFNVIEHDRKIRAHIRAKMADKATISDILVFFVGHGSTLSDNKFAFFIKTTAREQRDISVFKSETLASCLRSEAPLARKWLFLDCCAAAAAYGSLQPAQYPAVILEREAGDLYPEAGTALFSACSSDAAAYNDPGAVNRMFTAALTHVLMNGDSTLEERLTLSEIAMLVRAEINRRYGLDLQRPELGDPDQRWGRLSTLPFFPNIARKQTSTERAVQDLQTRVRQLEAMVTANAEAVADGIKVQHEQHQALRTMLKDLHSRVDATATACGDEVSTTTIVESELSLEQKLWWERARSATMLSRVYAVTGLMAILIQAVGAGIPKTTAAASEFFYMLCVATGIISVLMTTPLLKSAESSLSKGANLPADSSAITGRTDNFWRIYLGEYTETPFGLMRRQFKIVGQFAFLASAVLSAALLLGYYPSR